MVSTKKEEDKFKRISNKSKQKLKNCSDKKPNAQPKKGKNYFGGSGWNV